MMEMIIVVQVKENEKKDLMKKLIDTFEYEGHAYLYLKNTNEILLAHKNGFVSFEYNESFYKDPKSGEEFGEMVITLLSTRKQLPLLVQEVIRELMYLGLHDNVTAYYINRKIE
jgi:hypothetical protein